MAESFPPAPGSGGGSFPQGHEPRDDAPTQDASALLFRRYRVIRELGRGGMGVVLLAHDTALDIPVAVKLLPDLVLKDTEAINDLRKEVLRGMALTHPGVVRTHNFERDESGAGIVMEFIEGPTLTELKAQQPGGCFDPEQILPWLEQLCGVLDYAHREAHIVHRDLKPRNVMLAPSRAAVGTAVLSGPRTAEDSRPYQGRIKVADFGIAALISDSMSKHSMEGKVSGTLSYMSPQQAQGMKPSALDDIHALGATIYELLTGKPPFFRGNPLMIQTQVITVVPPRLSERREELEVRGKSPIPPQWEETIAACLAKDPAERPQSAGEVLARLRSSSVEHPARVPFGAAHAEHSTNAATVRPASEVSAHREDFREPRKPAPELGAPPMAAAASPPRDPAEPQHGARGLHWFAGSMVLALVVLNYCYSRFGAGAHTLVAMQALPLLSGIFLGWLHRFNLGRLFVGCVIFGYLSSLVSVQLAAVSNGAPLVWDASWWLWPVWTASVTEGLYIYSGAVNYFGLFTWTVPVLAGCGLASAIRIRRDRQ